MAMRNSKRNSKQDGKQGGQRITPEKKTGVRSQRIDLHHPDPKIQHQMEEQPLEEQPLLPHERNQAVRYISTGLGALNEQSGDVIGQIREDSEHGLEDTDRFGVPSDIVASDVAPGVQNKDEQP